MPTLKKSLSTRIQRESDPWLDRQPAWLGDENGVVLTSIAGTYNARLINGKVVQVYNWARVAPDYDIPVLIGRHRDIPTIWQIIDGRQPWLIPASGNRVEYHRDQHLFMAGDEMAVDRRQILQLAVRISSAAGFIVTVYPDIRLTVGGNVKIAAQTVDLSSYVVTEGAKYVSIESDDAGALSVHEGVAFGAKSAATAADMPVPDSGKYTRAHVLLYEGQSALSDADISVPWPADFNPIMWVRRFPDQPSTPTVTDDEDAGYRTGDLWITETLYGFEAYLCLDPSAGAAEWLELGIGGVGAVDSVNGQTGAVLLDYSDISAQDADTDVTGAELEELTDGSETSLHSHAGASPAWGAITGTLADQTDLQGELDGKAPLDGWIAGPGTWSFSSADDPTFVISIDQDVTGLFEAGDRIKLTQTSVKYFIVTAVGSYSGGATPVTVYGGTDYDLANAAIASPYYSHIQSPLGMPMDQTKWTVEMTDTSDRFQASPVQNTWYNPGSLSISIPIGSWDVEYFFQMYGTDNSNTAVAFASLSTSNNSESDVDLTRYVVTQAIGATAVSTYSPLTIRKTLTLASKTTYYPITKTNQASQNTVGFNNASGKMIIRAICGYL